MRLIHNFFIHHFKNRWRDLQNVTRSFKELSTSIYHFKTILAEQPRMGFRDDLERFRFEIQPNLQHLKHDFHQTNQN